MVVESCRWVAAGTWRAETPPSKGREQERPSRDPCRLYSTLFNNLDAGLANLEVLRDGKGRVVDLPAIATPNRHRSDERPVLSASGTGGPEGADAVDLCRQNDHLRL